MKRRTVLAAGLAAAAIPIPRAAAASQALWLENELWGVSIDMHLLHISVVPAGRRPVTVSRGGGEHEISDLIVSKTSASWRRDENYLIACTLDGPDLRIRISATGPGTLALLDQPAAAMGKGLLLPISEGYYLAASDTTWRAALDGEERSTNEDMSLPLWGMDHGEFTLHWLLHNPYNNALHFKAEGDGLALKLDHEFTRLAPEEWIGGVTLEALSEPHT